MQSSLFREGQARRSCRSVPTLYPILRKRRAVGSSIPCMMSCVRIPQRAFKKTGKGKTPKHADQSLDVVPRLIAVVFGAKPHDIDGQDHEPPQARTDSERDCLPGVMDTRRSP
jgi:hypothetical protein